MKNVVLTAAAILAGLAFTTSAGAYEPAISTPHASVRYSDLDLGKPAGAETMFNRLKQAATRVCGGKPDSRLIFEQRIFRRCVDNALDDAVAKLDAPLVTALHADQAPRFARRESD